MLRALGLRRDSGNNSGTGGVKQGDAAPLVLQQAHDFEVSLQAMDFLLDDRTEEGLHLIQDDPNSAIKTMASGVIRFLEATLGFEPEVMKRAGEILSRAESLSSTERAKSQRLRLSTSRNFPPGTEYAVTYAEANLLNALVMLLSESMIESARALYKLRKAYQTLDEVSRLIAEYDNKKKKMKTQTSNESNASLDTKTSGSTFADIPFNLTEEQLSDAGLSSLSEKVQTLRLARLNGAHIGNSPASERLRASLGSEDTCKESDSMEFMESETTIDEFIISGTNLCFGILQLVLSLIPPAIGKVLSVVGFKGDKENGLKLIWKSVNGRNIHGCIGLLALLVFYDGPFQFTDADFDVPDNTDDNDQAPDPQDLSLQKIKSLKIMRTQSKAFQGIGKPTLLHPGKKLEDALLYARALFPHSALWLSQEARMLSSRGKLQEALNLMNSIDRNIEMKQVEALLLFDKMNNEIFLHKYEDAIKDIERLLVVNDWSPGLYTYCAGCCYLELYRMCQLGLIKDESKLKQKDFYRSKAKELIESAPIVNKQKKGRSLPFDKYMLRKIDEFQSTASKYNLDIIDAIGTSPTSELMYFWNGYNRMNENDLTLTQELLDFGVSDHAKFPESTSSKMVRKFLESLILRRMGHYKQGDEMLNEEVLKYTVEFTNGGISHRYVKTHHAHNPWLYPSAMYEKSLFIWKQYGVEGLDESRNWLKLAQGYADDYELSTRIGMKIKAASDRLEGL